MAKWIVVAGMLLLNVFACRSGTFSPDANTSDAPLQDGTLSFSWTLNDGTNDVSCAQVAGITVGLLLTPAIGGYAKPDSFSCGAGSVTTRFFAAATYNVKLELIASEGSLAEPILFSNVEVPHGGNTDLGELVFQVLTVGNLQFFIDTDSTGLNCDPAPGGGGVNSVTFELRDAANQCVGTFDIAAGATQSAGTTDCGVQYGCIENDQLITVSDISSGPYTLIITADRGGLPCYSRSPQFDVPGNNLTADLNTQLLIANPAIIGCLPDTNDAGVSDAGVSDAGP